MVTHPQTGMNMQVAVPEGVEPGQPFDVMLPEPTSAAMQQPMIAAPQPMQMVSNPQTQMVQPQMVQPLMPVQTIMVARPEAAALSDLKSMFYQLAALDNNPTTFDQSSFAMWVQMMGIQLGNTDTVFGCLDVDNSGHVDVDEFLFAVAGRYIAQRGSLDVNAACRVVVEGLANSLVRLADDDKLKDKQGNVDMEKANVLAKELTHEHQEGHGRGVECGEYVLATVVPCYICCEARGESVSTANELIRGMEQCLAYIVSVKDANMHYGWHIQNYHVGATACTRMPIGRALAVHATESACSFTALVASRPRQWEKRTRQKDGGGTETYWVRVNTHCATQKGVLASQDTSPIFDPNTKKANLALSSELAHPEFDPNFITECMRRSARAAHRAPYTVHLRA
jgi:hypothetical protein